MSWPDGKELVNIFRHKCRREILSLNLKRFKKGIDLIGLKTGNFAIVLSESGFNGNVDYSVLDKIVQNSSVGKP